MKKAVTCLAILFINIYLLANCDLPPEYLFAEQYGADVAIDNTSKWSSNGELYRARLIGDETYSVKKIEGYSSGYFLDVCVGSGEYTYFVYDRWCSDTPEYCECRNYSEISVEKNIENNDCKSDKKQMYMTKSQLQDIKLDGMNDGVFNKDSIGAVFQSSCYISEKELEETTKFEVSENGIPIIPSNIRVHVYFNFNEVEYNGGKDILFENCGGEDLIINKVYGECTSNVDGDDLLEVSNVTVKQGEMSRIYTKLNNLENYYYCKIKIESNDPDNELVEYGVEGNYPYKTSFKIVDDIDEEKILNYGETYTVELSVKNIDPFDREDVTISLMKALDSEVIDPSPEFVQDTFMVDRSGTGNNFEKLEIASNISFEKDDVSLTSLLRSGSEMLIRFSVKIPDNYKSPEIEWTFRGYVSDKELYSPHSIVSRYTLKDSDSDYVSDSDSDHGSDFVSDSGPDSVTGCGIICL